MIAGALRRLRRLIPDRTRGMILMYHRIDTPAADPWGICVGPRQFAEQMEVLARLQIACPLARIQHRRRSVAVTFDDGYADNLYVAKSVLERYDVPSNVFVVTGSSGQPSFWWDELEQIFLHTPRLSPDPLVLCIRGQEHRWQIRPEEVEIRPADHERLRDWIAWRDDPPTSRHAIFRSVWDVLRGLGHKERSHHVSAIQNWARNSGQSDRVRPMTRQELSNIASGGLVELGAHTVTHPRLADLAPEEQAREIVDSRNSVAEISGKLPSCFSYPFGGSSDYTAQTVKAVREAGFSTACCTTGGLVSSSSDPLQLPRAHVGNWDGEEFSRWLSDYLKS